MSVSAVDARACAPLLHSLGPPAICRLDVRYSLDIMSAMNKGIEASRRITALA